MAFIERIKKSGKSAISIFKKLSLKKKTLSILIVLGVFILLSRTIISPKSSTPQYQTAQATRGTLIQSVTASGTISSASTVPITTQATGVISKVYVSDGDSVTQGQKIADITLDQNGQQRQAQAYASYLSAVNSQKTSADSKLSGDASMWSAQQALLNAQNDENFKNNNTNNPSTKQPYTDLEKQSIDSALTQAQKNFQAAQQKYLDADSSVNAAAASLTSSSLAYQQVSSSVIAPAGGTISNLNLTPGTVITSSSTGTSTGNSTQAVGNILVGEGALQTTVNVSEVDAPKVSIGQKATLTLDAFPDQTFTGKVSAIDTNGAVSSGVTTYPTTITLDTSEKTIYLNMGDSATIITNIKDDVILVPTAAVETSANGSTVRVLKNGQVSSVDVQIGQSNDTETEITSGINEGDTVVTGTVTTGTTPSGATTSPFSGSTGIGGLRTGGGGFGGGTAGGGARRGQ